MNIFHSALDSKNINLFFLPSVFRVYFCGLLLTNGRKNCSSMSKSLGISTYSFYEYLKTEEESKKIAQKYLIEKVHLLTKQYGRGHLVVDGWVIPKLYASKIPNLTYDRWTPVNKAVKGHSHVTIAWTNTHITIPLVTEAWINKKDSSQNYRKKTEIAQELILSVKDKVDFDVLLMDGGYCSREIIAFCENNDILYAMRVQSNRNITPKGTTKGLNVKKIPELKLIRNQRYKTIVANYQGIPCFVTRHKRKGRNKKHQIVHVISNIPNLFPKQYIDLYAQRWPIEKMFRTCKQSLGIGDCQARSRLAQENHFYAVFVAFAILEIKKMTDRQKSPEAVIHKIRPKISPISPHENPYLSRGFMLS